MGCSLRGRAGERGARGRAAAGAIAAAVIAVIGLGCSRDATSPTGTTVATATVTVSAPAPTEPPPSPSPSGTASSIAAPPSAPTQGKFVRERPQDREGIDACAYLGGMGFACLDALMNEKNPVRRRYMRRMSDADARLSLDAYERGEAAGIPHAELSLGCAERGPCGKKDAEGNTLDDGYACLTKAQSLIFEGDKLGSGEAHARACKCGATRAQLPIMGGFLACDGPKPVERGKELSVREAKDIRACAECDAEAGPAACAREIQRFTEKDAELAKYIESEHVPRCQKP